MDRIARCHCGALRVIAAGDPDWINMCHCTACQRRTGAVAHSGAYYTGSRLRMEGESKVYTRTAENGSTMRFHFCPTCGSNVYWSTSRLPDHRGVAVGAFADPEFPAPSYSVWQRTKHRWVQVPDEV